MTKRRLMQAILAVALFRLSRSPSDFVTFPSHHADKPLTLGGHLREALMGSGLIPARLGPVVDHTQGANSDPSHVTTNAGKK